MSAQLMPSGYKNDVITVDIDFLYGIAELHKLTSSLIRLSTAQELICILQSGDLGIQVNGSRMKNVVDLIG